MLNLSIVMDHDVRKKVSGYRIWMAPASFRFAIVFYGDVQPQVALVPRLPRAIVFYPSGMGEKANLSLRYEGGTRIGVSHEIQTPAIRVNAKYNCHIWCFATMSQMVSNGIIRKLFLAITLGRSNTHAKQRTVIESLAGLVATCGLDPRRQSRRGS